MIGLDAVTVTLAWAVLVGTVPAPQRPALDRSHLWIADELGEGEALEFVLVRGERVDAIRSDTDQVVRAVNTVLASIALGYGGPVAQGEEGPPTIRWLGVRAGTAKVEVIGAEYLGERMGTTGADRWLASATFTLTEIPGVKAVEFLFEEGSHASPGRYTRADFGRFKLVRK